MKRNFKRILLTIMIIACVLCGVIISVPRILKFVDGFWTKQEYKTEDISENKNENIYGDDYINISGNNLKDENVSGNIFQNSGVSVNSVSSNSVSANNVSSNSVSGNSGFDNKFTTVDDEYFDDALFIGDSRTVGLYEYSDLDQADFYAATGLTIYKVLESKIVPVEGSDEKITIEEVLEQKQYGKIYIMLGINEMGRGDIDSFVDKYTQVVNRLQELQPNAIIYVQSIMKVSQKYSELSDYIHNEGIDERNERLSEFADGQQIFYIDVNPLICDETGGLDEAYTTDGVHLKAEYINIWTDFLKENGVVK